MNRINRIPIRITNLSFSLAILLAGQLMTYSLLGNGHRLEYNNEVALIKDFLNVSIKADQPIAYWISQLIGIFEKKHSAKELSKKLRSAQHNPKLVFKILAANDDSSTASLRIHIFSYGIAKAQKALEARLNPVAPSVKTAAPLTGIAPVPTHGNTFNFVSTEAPKDEASCKLNGIPVEKNESSSLGIKSCCALSFVALTALWISLKAS